MIKLLNVSAVKSVILLSLFTIIGACNNQKPQPITIGSDNCAFCKMGIVDQRFAGEIKTAKGKVYTFDSIECLVSFYQNHQLSQVKRKKIWIHDFFHPKEWLPVTKAYFAQSDRVHTPMGMGLIALENETDRTKALSMLGGTGMDWIQIVRYVKRHMKS